MQQRSLTGTEPATEVLRFTRTMAPYELLSTPVIPEKAVCDQLLKLHLVLTMLRLDWDTFVQVPVWKWCI